MKRDFLERENFFFLKKIFFKPRRNEYFIHLLMSGFFASISMHLFPYFANALVIIDIIPCQENLKIMSNASYHVGCNAAVDCSPSYGSWMKEAFMKCSRVWIFQGEQCIGHISRGITCRVIMNQSIGAMSRYLNIKKTTNCGRKKRISKKQRSSTRHSVWV